MKSPRPSDPTVGKGIVSQSIQRSFEVGNERHGSFTLSRTMDDSDRTDGLEAAGCGQNISVMTVGNGVA